MVVIGAIFFVFRDKLSPPGSIKFVQLVDELENRLSSKTVPFIIRVVNHDIPQLASPTSERIAETDIWDWTFIGPHPDSHPPRVPVDLVESLKNQYFRQENVENIRTSSLCLLKDYPWGHKSMIFFGNLFILPQMSFKLSDFPKFPLWFNQSSNIRFVFTALYEHEARLNSKMGYSSCVVYNNDSVIQERWDTVREQLLRLDINHCPVITWTDSPPASEDIDETNVIEN